MLSGGERQIMLLRMMSSPTERSGEGSNGNGNAAPHHSLNSFVVSHQTPLSQAKFHRRPGLPKVRRLWQQQLFTCLFDPQEGDRHHTALELTSCVQGRQTGSAGNLLAAGQPERVRLSLDVESNDLKARACFIERAKSASHELLQQDWMDRWDPNGVTLPTQAQFSAWPEARFR